MLSSPSLTYACLFFFLMIRRPPRSTLFPYTRSSDLAGCINQGCEVDINALLGRRNRRQGDIVKCGPQIKQVLGSRSEEHTSELQSQFHLVCRLLLEKKKNDQSRAIAK